MTDDHRKIPIKITLETSVFLSKICHHVPNIWAKTAITGCVVVPNKVLVHHDVLANNATGQDIIHVNSYG